MNKVNLVSSKNTKNNAGVAMIFSVIVGAVIMVFCLTLLLVTYTLFAQSNRKTTELQCKVLAQSCSESLKKELANPDSELCQYLSSQIEKNVWISEEQGMSYEDGILPVGQYQSIVIEMEDGTVPSDYRVSISFEYSLNQADDDGDVDAGNDDDDNDDDDDGDDKPVPGDAPTPGDDEPASYLIKAQVKCIRGLEGDRDSQSYVIEVTYPAVSL